jgi:hypothetical protein
MLAGIWRALAASSSCPGRELEDAGEAHEPGDRAQDRLAGGDTDLGEPTGLQELRLAQ